MDALVSIGDWIASRRKTLDLTQRDLASQTACSPATIKKIEMGARRPSRELALLLAAALQVPEGNIQVFVECARGLRSVDALTSPKRIHDVALQESAQGSAPPEPLIQLPAPSTPFIGREAELTEIAHYLGDPTCRLLTLIGPGGIGKTRLAYQVASAIANLFPSGVHGVPLAGVSTIDDAPAAIADRLNLPAISGDAKKDLFNYLRNKRLLLVLDNLEHLQDGDQIVAEILAAAPDVKILATSRERLNLRGEWLFPVRGLPFPKDAHQANARSYSAIQLFERSARRVLPGFDIETNLVAAVRVCELVEGMPLAIELAASWTHRIPCGQIAEQIQSDFTSLSANWRDAPERHRSIRALFEHSWRLLSPDEQDVMSTLSVFRGGFDLEAAQQVAGASWATLMALEDKSLVQGNHAGRFELQEVVRQYAYSRLANAGQATQARNRHLRFFTEWAEVARSKLFGAEQVAWVRRIEAENANLQAALAWSFNGGDAEQGLRIANALWFYWFRCSGSIAQGLRWTELGLKQTEGVTAMRAEAFAGAATLAGQTGQLTLAVDYLQQSLEYAQLLGLQGGIARVYIGGSYTTQDYAEVDRQLDLAARIFREMGDRPMLATTLLIHGDRARVQGYIEQAQSLLNEALLISRAEQNPILTSEILVRLGLLCAVQGNNEMARRFYEEGVTLGRQLGNTFAMGEYLIPIGALLVYQGELESARGYLEESLAIAEELNLPGMKAHVTYLLAELALHNQEHLLAARWLAESVALTLSNPDWQSNFTNHEFSAERLVIAGKLAHARGDFTQAAFLLSAGDSVRSRSGYLFASLAHQEFELAMQECQRVLDPETWTIVWQGAQTASEEDALLRAMEYLREVVNVQTYRESDN